MSDLLKIQFEYQSSLENPIKLKISTDFLDAQKNENSSASRHPKLSRKLASLKTQIKDLELKIETQENEKEAHLKKILDLQKENENLSTQLTLIEKAKSNTQEINSRQAEEVKDLKKKNKENEKIIQTHFDLIEDLKSKYSDDLKQKTSELEKKLNDIQKALNVKNSQVFKLSQQLKEREQKRSSAEIVLDDLEKKNNELLEKNLRLEKSVYDQEKKTNELSKRLSTAVSELKSNDEILAQKDQQVKKLVSKIRSQENLIFKLEEELKAKDRKILEAQQGQKISKSVDIRTFKASPDELQKVWELVASKEEEISIMKDMLKSFQNKHVSPSSSKLGYINKSKLPPISSGALKENKEIRKELVKVKSDFKIRELDTRPKPKPLVLRKPEKNTKNLSFTPQKKGENKDHEETPKFKEPFEASQEIKRENQEGRVFIIEEEDLEKSESYVKVQEQAEEKRMSFGVNVEKDRDLIEWTRAEQVDKGEEVDEEKSGFEEMVDTDEDEMEIEIVD